MITPTPPTELNRIVECPECHVSCVELRASVLRQVAAAAREKARLMRVTKRLPKLSAAEWLDHFASDLESGLMAYVAPVCGKCRALGSIGPCDEHGPMGTP